MKIRWAGTEYECAENPTKWLNAECQVVEDKFNCDVDELRKRTMMMAMAYVTIKRHQPQFTWKVLDALTFAELGDLFITDEEDTSDEEETPTEPAAPSQD